MAAHSCRPVQQHLLLLVAAPLLLLLLASLGGAAALPPTYADPGPCTWDVVYDLYRLPKEAGCEGSLLAGCTVAARVHVPRAPSGGGGGGCPEAPFPLVAFFNGFLMPSSAYVPYAEHLASWGFAVFQYDLKKERCPFNLSTIHTDSDETRFFPFMLQRLQQQAADPASPLSHVDQGRLATAGHSRGGKLATWHLTDESLGVLTAYLIDPIDNVVFNLLHPADYPSAAARLWGKNKTIGITAASRHDACNDAPIAAGNYLKFYDAAADGSWLEVVANAGHMEFAASGLITGAVDRVCCLTHCSGLLSHELSIYYAAAPLTAWMQKELRGAPAPTATEAEPSGEAAAAAAAATAPSGLAGFFGWVCREQAADAITFEVKGEPGPCGGGGGGRGQRAAAAAAAAGSSAEGAPEAIAAA